LVTTNARKPIKGSKHADFSLVSIKKANKELPLGGGSPGSANHGQTRLNLCSHLLCHPPNNLKSKTSKMFFNRRF